MAHKGVIWVTGASSGIGKETAKEFARIGCKVYASARKTNLIELANKELIAEGCDNLLEIIPCNVASDVNVETTLKKILANDKIDCLVNNAGITSFETALDNSLNEIKDIINTNLLGSIFTIKGVLPSMIENGGGTIINILSVVVKKIFTNSSAYSASKAGLLAYTNVLREELRDKNIKIVNILPGATNTNIWPDKAREKYQNRMIKPEDVARIIVSIYLQSPHIVTEEITLRPITGDL
ncbi:MAG TPA: SDR family oxidoreductase [Ignavibacteriales bacterium]|nr:SDR family oxidoreductase [Ignavibacteriales bacterium]HOL80978.1 SDR family oxidoreductase [Ignavibacteriales bacterium]HOM64713.1 SDR family oxidoreductase [Ignavibacteriales bacterium]HPD66755.1 SDR family oxidoreductase [Ignavibacteriales bacterium]HPP32758.1 SDR family oxidoreductase [Ignavibacteriales bacterium]